MNEGWILITRKLLSWQWFDKSEMVHLWLYLLLTANIKPKKWHGMTIERGQVVVSVKGISEHLRLSVWQVRNGLERLKETGEITTKTTNKYTVVTICNYCGYQDYIPTNPQTNHKQTTNKPQSNHNQTTNKPQQLNKETSKQGNNETRYIEILGANAPLSPEGDGVSDTTPEIPENGEKTDAADNTLTLTPPQPKKEKSCAKKEKAGADYKWDEIREWFNGTVASAPDCKIKKIQAFNDKRKETFRKAMRTFGRDKVAEAIKKATTVPYLNGANDINWRADFDFILNPNKLPRILEGFYDHLHEKKTNLKGAAVTLNAYEEIMNDLAATQNGNNTDTPTDINAADITLGDPAQYLAALGNI